MDKIVKKILLKFEKKLEISQFRKLDSFEIPKKKKNLKSNLKIKILSLQAMNVTYLICSKKFRNENFGFQKN